MRAAARWRQARGRGGRAWQRCRPPHRPPHHQPAHSIPRRPSLQRQDSLARRPPLARPPLLPRHPPPPTTPPRPAAPRPAHSPFAVVLGKLWPLPDSCNLHPCGAGRTCRRLWEGGGKPGALELVGGRALFLRSPPFASPPRPRFESVPQKPIPTVGGLGCDAGCEWPRPSEGGCCQCRSPATS